jgi:hypothetical protein
MRVTLAARHAAAPALLCRLPRLSTSTINPALAHALGGRAHLRTAVWASAAAPDDSQPARTPKLDGLKEEATRVLSRAQKRLAKAQERATACAARQAELLADPHASDADLGALPNCAELAAGAVEEGARAAQLENLVVLLDELDGPADPRALKAFALAAELGVNDFPPARPPMPAKKPKGPPSSKGPRLPYRIYTSAGGAEIRVGRTAPENDQLSCDAAHRDSIDWWLHAAGCPGSHVVVRARSLADAESLPREVELDAAMLAAKYSKANPGGTVTVTLCRARQVKKPPGAPPGMVQLSGSVRTVKVAWTKEVHRLERLEATVAPAG